MGKHSTATVIKKLIKQLGVSFLLKVFLNFCFLNDNAQC